MSRSTFYRVSKPKESEEIELEKAVINCFEKNKGNYGRIRIKKDLSRKGITISENKISRILKEHGLVAKSGRTGRRKAPKLTEEQYIEANLIKDKFEIDIPNYLWCSDITELALVKYFEFYYNSDRIHSGIGYLTPNEYFEKLTL